MTEPIEEKGMISKGTEESKLYIVQFRSSRHSFMIKELNVIADSEWKDAHLTEGFPGIPLNQWHMKNIGYGVPFHVAEAHRWWLICLVETQPGSIETRIMERKMVITHELSEVGVVEKMPPWEESRNIWGKSEAPVH